MKKDSPITRNSGCAIFLIGVLALSISTTNIGCSAVKNRATPAQRIEIVSLEEQIVQYNRLLAGDTLSDIDRVEVTKQLGILHIALDGIEQDVNADTISSIFDWIPWIPQPAKAPIGKLLAGLLPFASGRVRSNVVKGLKAVKKGDIVNALMAPLRTVGLAHTNSDPIEVMRGAVKAANEKGDSALALKIQATINAMIEAQAKTISVSDVNPGSIGG